MLGRSGDLRPDERERVAALVDDPCPWVRAEVAAALAGDPADTRPGVMIASLLHSVSEDDRAAGLHAAARVPDRIPPDELRRFLADPSSTVRAAAISALAK